MYQRLDALGIHHSPCQRAGVDHDEHLAQPRLIAFLHKKRVRLGAELGPGEGRDQQLDHQGQHRALGAAHGQHGAFQPPSRIGGGLALGVQRPTQGNGLALFGRHHQLATRHLGQGQVNADRQVAVSGEHRRQRVGAKNRPQPAGRRHGRRGIAEGQPHHARGCGGLQVVGRCAKVVAVGHRADGDAADPRPRHGFGHRQGAGGEGKAVARVHQHRARPLGLKAGLRMPQHPPCGEVASVHRHA